MDTEHLLPIRQQIAILRFWTFGLFTVCLSASVTVVLIFLNLPQIIALPHMQNPDDAWRLSFIVQGLIYLTVVSFFVLLVCQAKIIQLRKEITSADPNEIALQELEESRRAQAKALNNRTES